MRARGNSTDSDEFHYIEQRYRIADQLDNNPSLTRQLTEAVHKAYPKAVTVAVDETGLPKKTCPSLCPYSLEQLLDKTFYPHLE